MSNSPQAEQIKQLLRALPKPETKPTIAEARASADSIWPLLTAELEGATYNPLTVAGRAAEWVVPPGLDDAPAVILYLHGGGYTLGSLTTHRKLVAHIAAAAARRALIVDYRLAPEHPFPAGLEDAVASYQWLLASGHRAADIAIGGDSAGGGLALATALSLRDAGEVMPGALVLLSPWTDLALTGETLITNADLDPLIEADEAEGISDYTGPDYDVKHPLISPLYADLSGLPRMLIQVGSDEVLLSDSTRIADNAELVGVDCTIEVWEGMFHVFQMPVGNMPEANEAVAKIGAWLRQA